MYRISYWRLQLSNSPFSPVFVYDSTRPLSPFIKRAQDLGCRMLDIRQPGTSVFGGNPRAIIYDDSANPMDLCVVPGGRDRFFPLKNTGVMIIYGDNKGHVRALPDKRAFVEWFIGRRVDRLNPLTGNYRLEKQQ